MTHVRITTPDFDAQVERLQADGSITVEDADTIREFADFLREMGPRPGKPGHDKARQRRAFIEHAEFCSLSEDDVARLRAAEDRARSSTGGRHG